VQELLGRIAHRKDEFTTEAQRAQRYSFFFWWEIPPKENRLCPSGTKNQRKSPELFATDNVCSVICVGVESTEKGLDNGQLC